MSDYIANARRCVDEEYQAIDDRLTAIGRFLTRMTSIQPTPHSSDPQNVTALGHTSSLPATSEDDACRAVRTVFNETIGSESTPDTEQPESILTTISEELSEPVAFALAPDSNGVFTDNLKKEIVSQATIRKIEAKVMKGVLERERSLLEETVSLMDETSTVHSDIDSESFETLSFPELQAHHETLETYRTQCCEFTTRRQSFLQDSTVQLPHVEITHRTFVLYLYQSLEIDHPILATVADLDDSCAATQRKIRDQMVQTV